MPRPLWKVLMAWEKAQGTITCDECFAVMEYLADEAAENLDPHTLQAAARRHLARCPDCRAHHLRRLDEMEALMQARGSNE